MDYLKKIKAGDEQRWTEIKPSFFFSAHLRSAPVVFSFPGPPAAAR
jgi:hypothetical protein